jgi:DNA polymerase III delta subunit
MPSATPSAVRKQIAQGKPNPLYLIVGDDDAEMSRLALDFASLVDEELRVFNVERLYATDKGVTGASIAEAARMLPMMADRRVVVVLRAEKLLKPKRRGKIDELTAEEADDEPAADGDGLEGYIRKPEPQTVLVFVASDVDRSRRLTKLLARSATIVECWGLKDAKDARVDLRQVARQAEQLVKQAVTEAGRQIEPAAARLVAERAGADIGQLRGDLERLLLYSAGASRITVADAHAVVSAESSQDDWAVTNAIQNENAAEALKQLALSLEAGAVPYMVLGQLAWFVRERLDPRRVPRAVEALFRTDVDLKSSGGDPRVLLERLVVELCGRG